jgi:macrolide-specific efflux system membrane fusion protein
VSDGRDRSSLLEYEKPEVSPVDPVSAVVNAVVSDDAGGQLPMGAVNAELAPPLEAKPKPGRWPRERVRRIALSALAGALVALGLYYGWRAWVAHGTAGATVLTAPATRGDLEDTVTATGTLQPKEYVDVGTQVSGQIKRLLVDVGAVVRSGQLLAEIDPSVYQSKVDADEAQFRNQQAILNDRQAQRALAALQLTRQQNMMRDEATTTEALQTAQADLKSASAQVDSLRAQMEQTESTLRGDQANLGYTKITAPMAGTVVSVAAKQGQTLNANQQAPIVLRIADLSTMTVEAQVSEADVSKLHVGMDVYFTTLGNDSRRYYGKLRQIPPTPTVVNNVVLYDALFEVPNPDRALMTQMTAQVFFVLASAKDAVMVPVAALRPVGKAVRSPGTQAAGRGPRSGSGPRGAGGGAQDSAGVDVRTRFAGGHALVSVMAADGKVADRQVTVGAMNRIYAEITSGLEPGEKVVIGTATPKASPVPRASAGALTGTAPRGGGR